mmetsp:Transcript_99022/g.264725  ORF Transcript_99022/g.264725 Transcript_99022/m.264725 type:complete len:99 (+) Transcript_99022:33-329(+)
MLLSGLRLSGFRATTGRKLPPALARRMSPPMDVKGVGMMTERYRLREEINRLRAQGKDKEAEPLLEKDKDIKEVLGRYKLQRKRAWRSDVAAGGDGLD